MAEVDAKIYSLAWSSAPESHVLRVEASAEAA